MYNGAEVGEMSSFRQTESPSDFFTIQISKDRVIEFRNTLNKVNSFYIRKNQLQITAIENLYKTKKLLQLDLQLANDLLSEEEYFSELENNFSKYSIDVKDQLMEDDVVIINEIIREVKSFESEISVDEISEIFSVNLAQGGKLLD